MWVCIYVCPESALANCPWQSSGVRCWASVTEQQCKKRKTARQGHSAENQSVAESDSDSRGRAVVLGALQTVHSKTELKWHCCNRWYVVRTQQIQRYGRMVQKWTTLWPAESATCVAKFWLSVKNHLQQHSSNVARAAFVFQRRVETWVARGEKLCGRRNGGTGYVEEELWNLSTVTAVCKILGQRRSC